MQNDLWLPTGTAAPALGISTETLKRRRDVCGGFLEHGTHYTLGPSRNSPIVWRVEKCREAFHQRGMQARRELAEAAR